MPTVRGVARTDIVTNPDLRAEKADESIVPSPTPDA
jgi:hypothetical protein